ncbi:uncharacterized protein LOC135118120 [Helicoverpa armigera]|uniref:uncharacterized protein LOC135118120 n=1 Tax=Helicoverpa armigera TaxID=29058 RepID=UPI003083C3E9
MDFLKYFGVIFILSVNIALHSCVTDNFDDILNPTSSTHAVRSAKDKGSTFAEPDDKWLVNALQDIAYYLRNHKFNEWDRRFYLDKPSTIPIGFYHAFPEPSLQALHWRVHQNCYKNFYECVKYLFSVIETSPFTRTDDIITTLNKKEITNETSIKELDENCKNALLYTEKSGLPFDTAIEKFQWRTSASYYMCWYTMLGMPALSMLGETCDNFANCLDSTYGNRNRDPRSDDKFSFACAMYSFCPDPCCPLKHVTNVSQCFDSESNPCYIENAKSTDPKHRECRFDRKDNQNFDDIVENKWNVSCYCKDTGFEWKSQFGMCVDTNECVTDQHNCDNVTENCINLPGTFQCICKWGYAFDSHENKCKPKNVLYTTKSEKNVSDEGFFDNLVCFLEYIGF